MGRGESGGVREEGERREWEGKAMWKMCGELDVRWELPWLTGGTSSSMLVL